MPNAEVDQVHCLAAMAEKYEGIVFNNINGNFYQNDS